MAKETKTTKKADDAKVSNAKASEAKASNFRDSLNSKSVEELRLELSKVKMDILAGKEKNTSLIKMIKKEVARKLAKGNSSEETK